MAAGRHRTTSFSPEEMIKLGEEMVEWVKENKETVLHLSEWYTVEKMFIYKEWKAFIQRPEFFPYYEKALRIVGKKYLDKNSDVRNGVAERWMRVYFKDLREEEDETAAYNASLKQKQEDSDQKELAKNISDAIKSHNHIVSK